MDVITAVLVGLTVAATFTLVIGGVRFGVFDNLLVGVTGAILGAWGFHAVPTAPSNTLVVDCQGRRVHDGDDRRATEAT